MARRCALPVPTTFAPEVGGIDLRGMTFSLYSAVVPSYLQILESLSGLLDKAESFCSEKRVAPEQIIEARLADDMHPFAYQVKSAAVHSLGAIEGVRRGVVVPDMTKP